MAGLRELASCLGARDVATHIASGNLLCTPPGGAADFDRALERAVQARFGFFREAISRSPEQLRALDAHPFPVLEARSSHVAFLLSPPEAAAVLAAEEVDTGPELWQLVGQDVHLRYAGGAGRAHPGLGRALRRLQTPLTARGLITVRTLVELAG